LLDTPRSQGGISAQRRSKIKIRNTDWSKGKAAWVTMSGLTRETRGWIGTELFYH